MRRRPDLFVIGAPKSGTSSLHRYLDDHPDVFMSRPKEPGYFAPDVPGTRKEPRFRFGADEARYLALFDRAGAARYCGESSTNYLMSTEAPRLVRDFAPHARIVAMLRNPVDLVHSLHSQRVAGGNEPFERFQEAIAVDDDRRAGRLLPARLQGFGVAYRDNAMLGAQLSRWMSAFPASQVHVIVFDDFIANTAAEFARLLRFLDVDAAFQPASYEVYNAAYRRRGLLASLYQNGLTRWLAGTALPAAVGEDRAAALRQRIGLRRVGRQRIRRQPMSAQLRASLESEFAADVAQLGRLIGRDLAAEWFRAGREAVPAELHEQAA